MDVGVGASESVPGALDGEELDLVDHLAAGVIAGTRIALGGHVLKRGALAGEHRGIGDG